MEVSFLPRDNPAVRISDLEIRPPQQARSQASLERVLQAGTEILLERGAEGFTVAEVSRRSGVSIGAIYTRAPSKDALIHALHHRAMESLDLEAEQELAVDGWDGVPVVAGIIKVVSTVSNLMLRHAKIIGVFMPLADVDKEIRVQGSIYSRRVATRFAEVLGRYRDEFTNDDPDLAIEMCFRLVYSAIARRIMRGETFESGTPVPSEVFVRELADASVAYLTLPRA